jgi:hypothetical protein
LYSDIWSVSQRFSFGFACFLFRLSSKVVSGFRQVVYLIQNMSRCSISHPLPFSIVFRCYFDFVKNFHFPGGRGCRSTFVELTTCVSGYFLSKITSFERSRLAESIDIIKKGDFIKYSLSRGVEPRAVPKPVFDRGRCYRYTRKDTNSAIHQLWL